MDYKTLLVHVDGGERSKLRLEIALDLAEACNAHLVALFAQDEVRIPSFVLAEAGDRIRGVLRARREEAERNAEREFVAATGRRTGAKVEWRTSTADALAAVMLHARYADLVIVGQPHPRADRDAGPAPEFAEELVLAAGRPVLMLPYAGRFAHIGRRTLIAWDAGREAARAVNDALPFLVRAESVEVVVFDPERAANAHGAVPGADIGLYLARHGARVSVARQSGSGLDVGAQILSRASDTGADLIVMGGYGHSRMREFVLGGVTRTLLESMTVPVLMSH